MDNEHIMRYTVLLYFILSGLKQYQQTRKSSANHNNSGSYINDDPGCLTKELDIVVKTIKLPDK